MIYCPISSKRWNHYDISVGILYLGYQNGTADLKTFFLGIGLFVLGLILYPVLMKDSQKRIK